MKLEVRNASFSYGKRKVWENINFTVESKEILAILGPNGAGKTTLLKSVMNLLSFETGEALLDGKNMKSIPHKELWKQISYVPQAKQGSPTNVRDMIVLGRSSHLPLFGQPTQACYQLADDIINELGIDHLAHKNCNELSGGELQMVLIGRALISKPKLLIMDEPESNLDYRNQLQVLEMIKKISKTTTCILNTHYPEHALRYADKALLVHKGQSLFGRVDEVITEDNLKDAFSIEVHIGSKVINDQEGHYIIPMKLT